MLPFLISTADLLVHEHDEAKSSEWVLGLGSNYGYIAIAILLPF